MLERALGNQNSVHANSASKTSRYRPEIDGLRAFAVVAVIINHFNKDILPGGFLGVDIFFVISGYVITSSLFGRPSKDFKDFISGFYERRIKRLVPALSVFILITSITICLFNPTPGLSLRTGITSLFGLSNLYLLKQSTDYFAQSAQLNAFTHTWSLGVEEQFYILFPFLIWFSGFGRQTKNGARNLFLAVGSLTIASLVGFLYLYQTNQPAAYFLMPSRFWEMAAGCLIFIGFQKRAAIEHFLEKVPPLLVVALIVGVMYLPMSLAAASTIAVVALSSILIASLKKQTAAFKVFTNPRVVYIGLISYSLYLWHWGVLSISRWTIGIHWWSVPFQVALMLGLAVASYRWIETPMRKGNWFGKRWKNLLAGSNCLVISALLIYATTTEPMRRYLRHVGSHLRKPAYSIQPRTPQSNLYCHLPFTDVKEAFNNCLKSESAIKKPGNSIYVFGDSHAANHYWSIAKAIKMTGSDYELKMLIEGGFQGYITVSRDCRDQKQCISNPQETYEGFLGESLKPSDFVFISIARDRFSVGKFKGTEARAQDKQRLEILYKRLVDLANFVEAKDAKLILIGDIPKVCKDSVNYSSDIIVIGKINECEVKKTLSLEDRKGLNETFIKVSKRSSHTIYVDPHNELCDEVICSAISPGGKLLYVDASPHFANEEKEILAKFWGNQLLKLGIGRDYK